VCRLPKTDIYIYIYSTVVRYNTDIVLENTLLQVLLEISTWNIKVVQYENGFEYSFKVRLSPLVRNCPAVRVTFWQMLRNRMHLIHLPWIQLANMQMYLRVGSSGPIHMLVQCHGVHVVTTVTVWLWLHNIPVVDACSSSYKKLEKQLQRKLQMQFRQHSPSIGGHRQHGGVALFVPLCKANRKGTKTIHLNVRLMGKVHTLIIVLPLTSTKTSKWYKQKSEPPDNLPHTATLDSCFLFHCLAYTHKYCVIYTAHSQNSHSTYPLQDLQHVYIWLWVGSSIWMKTLC
jgi:hypothetical protein